MTIYLPASQSAATQAPYDRPLADRSLDSVIPAPQGREPQKKCHHRTSAALMDNEKTEKTSGPQGLSLGLGIVFGVILYVLTREAFWIPIGIALGAAREMRARK